MFQNNLIAIALFWATPKSRSDPCEMLLLTYFFCFVFVLATKYNKLYNMELTIED